MKKIQLTNSEDMCYVDNDTYAKYGHLKWRVCRGYVIRNKPIVKGEKMGYYFLHRVIMGIDDPSIIIDHINQNPLDNRRANLRLCDRSENGRNRGKQKNSSHKYKGIHKFSPYSRRKPYHARVQIRGKVYYGPWRGTDKEAAIDYNIMAKKYHGKFACLNVIED